MELGPIRRSDGLACRERVEPSGRLAKIPRADDVVTLKDLTFDSQGRLFVADCGNNRIQIFDQEGRFIAQWTQFSRPSGIFIDQRDDTLYVADSESGGVAAEHGAWRRGIRIGSARDGSLRAFIPDSNVAPDYRGSSSAEGVAVDAQGVVYGAEVGQKDVARHVLAP